MVRTCAHPRCRTSLDEFPVLCPHGFPFCGSCTWEEACTECATAASFLRGADAIRANAASVPTRELLPPCRCGWPDDKPHGVAPVRVPVLDLTGTPGVKEVVTSPNRKRCAACTHPIQADRPSVVQRLTNPGSVLNRYHTECVVIP